MNYFFYRLNPPRSTFPGDMTPAESKLMGEHAAYWKGLMKQGRVVAFGPVADPKGVYGIGIIRAEDRDEAISLAANDPVVLADLAFSVEVHPMASLVLPEQPD